MAGMRKFTLLGKAVGGFRGLPAGRSAGEDGQRQRSVGIHDPGGKCRHLFGAGEGPAEAVAEAKQATDYTYPLSFVPHVLISAKTAARMCSANWGHAATTSAKSAGSRFDSITLRI